LPADWRAQRPESGVFRLSVATEGTVAGLCTVLEASGYDVRAIQASEGSGQSRQITADLRAPTSAPHDLTALLATKGYRLLDPQPPARNAAFGPVSNRHRAAQHRKGPGAGRPRSPDEQLQRDAARIGNTPIIELLERVAPDLARSVRARDVLRKRSVSQHPKTPRG
jgi:hypothetical protein